MTIGTWLTFISVVFVFAIIPGPTVILVIGQAITLTKYTNPKQIKTIPVILENGCTFLYTLMQNRTITQIMVA